MPIVLGILAWGGAAALFARAGGINWLTAYLVLSLGICLTLAYFALGYAVRPHHPNRFAPLVAAAVGTTAISWAVLCGVFTALLRISPRKTRILESTE